MSAPAASDVALLEEALVRFIALSECGLRACDSQDAAALAGALDARELVTQRMGDLIARAPHGNAARGAWRTLSDRTREASRLNQELADRAALLRDDIRRQIDRVNHDDAALGAYAGATPRAVQLDLRR